MDLQLTAVKTDPMQAAQALAHLLRQTPEYEAFLKSLHAVNDDLTVQKLFAELRAHKTALQWGHDPDGLHNVEVTRLELEIGDLRLVKQYHRAEKEISQLLRSVDQIVSEEAGINFAVNAQSIGCACGG